MATLAEYLADPRLRASLPAGLRNNNPGNIKYVGQPGTRPSVNTDQGDPQAVYGTPEAGLAAAYRLALKKYTGGKRTAAQLIAGQGGWTPGNSAAAVHVASYGGYAGPNDDLRLNEPEHAVRFLRGLMMQEHGDKNRLYTDDMLRAAIGGGTPAGAGADLAAPINEPSIGKPSRLGDLMNPQPVAQQSVSVQAPQMIGDARAVQTTVEPGLGDMALASLFQPRQMLSEQIRAKQEARAEADQRRRMALFSAPLA